MCHREGNTRQVFLGDNLQKLHEKDIELHHILLTMQEGNEKKEKMKQGRKETEMKLPFLLLYSISVYYTFRGQIWQKDVQITPTSHCQRFQFLTLPLGRKQNSKM